MATFFFYCIDSALFSPHICLSNWAWLLSLSGCAATQGGCTLKCTNFIMYTQMAISSMDMLFSLKSHFLGPCRKAVEWEIQWIIYWSDWVRYVAVVFFKTVNSSSLMWFSAYSGFSVSKNQNWEYVLKWMLECFPVFWHGMSFVFLELKAWGVLLFCLAWYRQAFSSASGFQSSTQLRKNC